jgi:hypothetical protein
MKLALSLLAGTLLAGGPPADEAKEGVTLTVYNQNFVVVRERRLLDFKEGRADVRFTDVAATIVPETVQFAVEKGAAARVVEQAYEFDLVSAAKLLDRYIDRDITVVTRDGKPVHGKLLSFDNGQLVLQTAAGVELVPRGGNVKDVQLSALPEGLLTRPTLLWRLDSKEAGKRLAKVSYAAGNMSWRVDYRARLNAAGDRLNLAGWVTVTNHTGRTFKDAKLRLMAGDLHVLKTPGNRLWTIMEPAGGERGAPAVSGRAFAEYHLYELERTTTLPDRSIKQIELLDVGAIPLTHRYLLREFRDEIEVTAEFPNDSRRVKGLGIPLPKGIVRAFRQGRDGEYELVGQSAIDHTPSGEPVRLDLGAAFDVVARRKEIARRQGKGFVEEDREVRLRNHKNVLVTVDVHDLLRIKENPKILRASHPHTAADAITLRFPVPVRPNAEAVLTYTVRYDALEKK